MWATIRENLPQLMVWGGLGAMLIVCVVIAVALMTKRYRDHITHVFTSRVGLRIGTEATWEAVRRRAFATAVGSLLGTSAAVVISVLVLLANPHLNNVNFFWIVVIPALLGLASAGQVVVALRDTLFHQRVDGPRIARPRAMRLEDYVPRWKLAIAPALLALLFAVNAAALPLWWIGAIDIRAYVGSVALPLLVAGFAAYVGGVVADRLVLRTPQPASDPAELAWNDAFVADTLRSTRLGVGVVLWIAVGSGLVGLLAGVDAEAGTTWSDGIGSSLLLWGYLALLLAFTTRASQQYYLRRLWPQVFDVAPAAARAEAQAAKP